jgi:hypothetical protein
VGGGGGVQYVISWRTPDIIKYINSQIQHKERDMKTGNMWILVIDKSNGNRSSHEKIRQLLHSTVFVWHTTMVFPNHCLSTCMNAENTMIEFFSD